MLCCVEEANATIPTLGSARRDCGDSYAMLNGETAPKVRPEPKKFTVEVVVAIAHR